MKYVVKWIELWDAEIEADSADEALEIACREKCNSPNADMYDAIDFEINWEDTERINGER